MMDLIDQHRAFGGEQCRYRHRSEALGCDMVFSLFLPPDWRKDSPQLYWLSGLTCTDENFVQKAGAQRRAAELGLILVVSDTSPRGEQAPDADRYDLGQGAGFYVNATQEPWRTCYRMEEYVISELPGLLEKQLSLTGKRGVSGHSMGGHGALTLAMRHPEHFSSVSAFSPIVAPTQVQWGRDAFTAYLGPDESAWREYDACHLLASGRKLPGTLLVDQGDADGFYQEQLRTWLLEKACEDAGQHATIRMQPGYDHSYFFVASFVDDHLNHHAGALSGS